MSNKEATATIEIDEQLESVVAEEENDVTNTKPEKKKRKRRFGGLNPEEAN